MSQLKRLQAWLAGLWAGSVLAVGGIAAPSLFAVLERAQAGAGAGRIFAIEANVSLALAILLFLLERRRVRDAVESGQSQSAMSLSLLLVLAALFLTIFGQHVLHPMIEAAKAGQATALSFGALHGISAALYWVKAAVVLTLAWRLTA
ncbi:DUF4149 domain-containing protein [Aquabacterium fontiphilum]|jgi:hypothetical protein|uniref:DUF4149 domain-containing protein n=1 Tax=Aquabacterium fontiphilum TaxID=450365 RepID=UPI00137863AA|nr:DUF4149 domain-containing protein [Aquabacterium fontiphilum]NBD20027.1 DUF4149 domain-containing protein [Aquabacterium fontiphilum]